MENLYFIAKILDSEDLDLPDANPDTALQTVVTYVFRMFIVVAIYIMARNAFTMVTANGNAENFAKGRKGFTMALVGIVLLMLSGYIVGIALQIASEA